MYKHQSKQMTIYDFGMPLGMELAPNNRWVEKSKVIPWDIIEAKYAELFKNSFTGNVAKPLRLVLGALLIQSERKISDEELVHQIAETPGLQYFCGLPAFKQEAPFHPSSMVHFRKRFNLEMFADINELIIAKASQKDPEELSQQNFSTPDIDNEEPLLPPKGTVIIDATCAPQNIRFPQDLSLLNEARENLETMIDELHDKKDGKKPRTYRKKARKAYLKIARKKNKTRKEIRKGVGQQIRFVKRNLKIIETYLASGRGLKLKRIKRLITINQLFSQQLEMFKTNKNQVKNRIVSLSQPWVRPIVRGKAKAKCEFGAKIQLSVTDGFTRLERTSFDAYNESEDFIDIIERWKKRNGHYPAKALADEIYRNKKNLTYCKEHGIEMLGKPLGRPKKGALVDKKRTRLNEIKRVEVERKISYAKGSFGLGLIKTKLQTTSKSVIALSIIAMNIAHAVRLIFVLIFKAAFCPIKNIINIIGLTKLLYDQKNNWLIGKIAVIQ